MTSSASSFKAFRPAMTMLCTALIASFSVGLQAEIYRWVDADGRTHYSDKKPVQGSAKNIDEELEDLNLDESSTERKNLDRALNKMDIKEQRYQDQKKAEHQQRAQQTQEHCQRLSALLSDLSGRVVLVDEQGKALKFTEKQRQQQQKELEQLYRQHCQ